MQASSRRLFSIASELLAQGLEDDVADDGGEERDGEVAEREDVDESDGERFALASRAVELAHQQIRVEEEDDESDLDQRAQDVSEGARGFGCGRHDSILQKIICNWAGESRLEFRCISC